MNVLQELDARLSNVNTERKKIQEEQKENSRKASENQKSLINLDGQEKILKELKEKFKNNLVTVIKEKHL